MQKFFQNRRAVLLVSILGLLSLVLLAGSLKGMDFRPSESFGSSYNGEVQSGAVNVGQLIQQAAEVPFWKQLFFWGMMFLIVLLISSLLDAELRKQLLYAFLRVALFALGFFYLIKKNPQMFAGLLGQLSISENMALNPTAADAPAPVFEPPQVSGWFSFAVTLGIILLIVLLIWWMNGVWTRMRELSAGRDVSLSEIAAIARASIKDLNSGKNYENAIIECYARMSNVVQEKQGLRREQTMTPTEFAIRLSRAGLPREPIERLTQLFESVRYGRLAAGQREIDEAVLSLTSILKYCGESE